MKKAFLSEEAFFCCLKTRFARLFCSYASVFFVKIK